ncbi:hypothetical protein SISNIDRAFT_420494, partial [Sistotremastrum niveocremeum HHB9708]
GIIDNGATIVAIREDLWHECGMALEPRHAMEMESADTGVSRTKGNVRNLPLIIGGICIYVQAQVLPKAPFRLLLGRPFLAVTRAVQQDHNDQDFTITITDPNPPSQTVTVSTRERNNGRKKPCNHPHFHGGK